MYEIRHGSDVAIDNLQGLLPADSCLVGPLSSCDNKNALVPFQFLELHRLLFQYVV